MCNFCIVGGAALGPCLFFLSVPRIEERDSDEIRGLSRDGTPQLRQRGMEKKRGGRRRGGDREENGKRRKRPGQIEKVREGDERRVSGQ